MRKTLDQHDDTSSYIQAPTPNAGRSQSSSRTLIVMKLYGSYDIYLFGRMSRNHPMSCQSARGHVFHDELSGTLDLFARAVLPTAVYLRNVSPEHLRNASGPAFAMRLQCNTFPYLAVICLPSDNPKNADQQLSELSRQSIRPCNRLRISNREPLVTHSDLKALTLKQPS